MHPQPVPNLTPAQLLVAASVGVVVLGVFGYRIYSSLLAQMAKNAKNKRLIRNEVTQWT